MELNNRLGGCDALVGDYVLAGVVAFLRAVPEEQAAEEGWRVSWVVNWNLGAYESQLFCHMRSSLACRPGLVSGRIKGGIGFRYLNALFEFWKAIAI